jgi:NADH-quinone oxidoreductase subunit M
VRWLALVGAVLSFLVTLPLITGFDTGTAALQFSREAAWIERFNVRYHLGVDGISVWFVLLTAFITVIVVVAGWEVITERVAQYMGAFLILSGLMVGVFCALDGLLFYVFFEATLIPMYIIIGVWGGPRRVYAAFKFFLYTLAGLAADAGGAGLPVLQVGRQLRHPHLAQAAAAAAAQTLLFFAFFAAFSVKVPMWPVHTWLPDAHVEAPTGGSVVLAAIMLKLGAYGFLRFSMPIAPDASREYAWFIITLSLIAVLYIGLVALVQQDMKKLVAYVHRAHGLRHAGLLHLQRTGRVGRPGADDQPRLRVGRHVPVHRRALRPRAQPRDRHLRRRGQHHAQVRGLRRAVRDGQLRPAGHRRLRRRVDGDPGRGAGNFWLGAWPPPR